MSQSCLEVRIRYQCTGSAVSTDETRKWEGEPRIYFHNLINIAATIEQTINKQEFALANRKEG